MIGFGPAVFAAHSSASLRPFPKVSGQNIDRTDDARMLYAPLAPDCPMTHDPMRTSHQHMTMALYLFIPPDRRFSRQRA
jgi:hypothetical protein